MRVLGIDYGEKKIGIALGDTDVRVASPLAIISNTSAVVSEIAELCRREDIGAVVVGVPVGISGKHSAQYDSAKTFAERLRVTLTIPVVTENEVLSTSAAQALTRGMSRGRADDDVAAMVILQHYLDTLS